MIPAIVGKKSDLKQKSHYNSLSNNTRGSIASTRELKIYVNAPATNTRQDSGSAVCDQAGPNRT
jgi:hypothetical protein